MHYRVKRMSKGMNKSFGRGGVWDKKNPGLKRPGLRKDRQRHTLPHCGAVPSAQVGLTSLFGMGRGDHHRYSHRKTFSKDTTYRVSTIRFDI